MSPARAGIVARIRAQSAGRGPSLSEVLRQLADVAGARVSIQDILDAFGDRAFGAVMLVLAAPNLLPLPPGSSSILAAPLVFVSAQLMIGRQVLWLPRFIVVRSFDRAAFRTMVGRLVPWLARIERLTKPRLGSLLGPVQDRIVGLACLTLALILFLPIPLGNMLPGLAITCFALGLAERDGLAILLGWLTALGAVALSTAVIAGLFVAAKVFLAALLGAG